MADVGDIANYAEIFGAIVVLGGLGFAVLELRRAREQRHEAEEQRRRESATAIFENMGSKEFISSQYLLREMPEGLGKKEMLAHYGDRMDDISWFLAAFERLGTMVVTKVVPIDLAWEFFQPSIMNGWRKLHVYIEEIRRDTGNNLTYLYFEWMANKIAEMSKDRTAEKILTELDEWRPT